MPKPITAIVGRFRFRQWQLLSLAARCPESIELFESTPALGFALASGVIRSKRARIKTLQRMGGKPRRKILEWLGFPATESTVKVFSKIPFESCGYVPLHALLRILQCDGGILVSNLVDPVTGID